MKEKKQILKIETTTDHPIRGNKRKYKMYYGDVLVYLNTDEIISLEMYKEFSQNEFKKNLASISRKFSNQFERGKNYDSGKKIIGINLILNNHLKLQKNLMNDYCFIDKYDYQNSNDEYLEMVLLNIDKVSKIVYDEEEEKLIKWLRLIGAESMEELKEIAKGEKEMEQAIAYMEDFLNDEEIQDVYDKIVDVADKAERKANINTAKKLLKMNLSIKNISEATGLSTEEIENLKNDI